MHPCVSQVATVGDEGTIRIWELQSKSLLHMRDLKSKARALAYSPNGTEISIALYSGDLVVVTENLDAIVTQVVTYLPLLEYSASVRGTN